MSTAGDARWASDECTHERQELRLRTLSDGRTQYAVQCLRCGQQVRVVPKRAPAVLALAALPPPYDDDLSRRYWDRKFSERAAVRARELEEQRQAYSTYLLSPAWRAKRAQRLRMDEGRCQARLAGCTGYATEVHHLTYRHLGDEPMFDIASVCRPCHNRITAMDRRVAGGGERDERAS